MKTTCAPAKVLAGPLENLRGRSLLGTDDWHLSDLEALLALAERLEALDRTGRRVLLLPGQLAHALFFDHSTRTRSAWAGAAARLGMHPVITDGTSSQVAHGETAAETGAMLGMNAHALGIRHDLILGEGNRFMRDAKQGIDDYLAATGDERVVPVVNLQCDIDHPTQALADLLWLRERFPDGLAGRTITMSWAYSPSYAKPLSVAQGVVTLMTRFGAHVHEQGGVALLDAPEEDEGRDLQQRIELDDRGLVVEVAGRHEGDRTAITGRRGAAGTRPSPRRCGPAGRRRPAPGGSRSCPGSPGSAPAP